ncbi:MAG: DUF6231 family protein [Spiribacter sp.]|nr:DUF6231 family protein [Spiribacter sp.]
MTTDALVDTSAMLGQLVAECASERVLLISDQSSLTRQVLAHGGQSLTGADSQVERLPDARLELAIVDGEANLSADSATTLVSRLRDVHAERVVVIAAADEGTTLSRQALIGLGFHRRGISADPGSRRRRWYEFDMAHYKVTPDWLNARHWANPELWDKYRW